MWAEISSCPPQEHRVKTETELGKGTVACSIIIIIILITILALKKLGPKVHVMLLLTQKNHMKFSDKLRNCTVQCEFSTDSSKMRYTTQISWLLQQCNYVACCRSVVLRTAYRLSLIWRSATKITSLIASICKQLIQNSC